MTDKKMTFVQRVKVALNLGEEGQIAKFQKDNLKALNKQVEIRAGKLEELIELKSEKREELKEASLNVVPEKVKTVQDRKSFIELYNRGLFGLLGEIDDLKDQEDTLSAEIEKYNSLIELLED